LGKPLILLTENLMYVIAMMAEMIMCQALDSLVWWLTTLPMAGWLKLDDL